ncbi:hypothetical protein K432DRAFT_357177 [Lepidopterella palustris CBS 459.81]|uniref:Xylanolytic transcriptional activator regulatory domain-containing protein n=1 Tax=Lepidopterella palustris CBS 459.81 TaxID=1314670 RepID=A0A8E2E6U0_9PEZI|nr:hypothetical protein K432DRAFT_357177 [Lepidopterella palustris CBS 459.81]
MPSPPAANPPGLAESPKRKASEMPPEGSVKRRAPRACLTWEMSEENGSSSAAAPDLSIAHNGHSASSTPPSLDQQAHRYPRYIRPLPAHIGSEDIDYLAKKDALTIPSDELRGLLLRHYVQYVHPFMPILDLEDFLIRIARDDPAKPISFLLFQAVMFVSVAFVPIESLHEAGFTSRKAARKIFFQRVRLLYGLDCEDDRVSLLQALLLMTYWYENPQDIKDTWYWMGISISLAQVLGVHRNPEHLKISPRAKRMHKRIWWSCYIRDRLLALGIRRPTRIRQQDFNVPMLTPDDFETPSIPHGILRSVCDWPLLQDADLQKTMAMALIEMAKLCVCIGNVLLSQYSILGDTATRAEADPTTMVIPRHSIEQIQDLARCDVELAEWYQSLNPDCRYKALGARSFRYLDENKRITRLHQAQLHMIYLTAVTVLHRPQALQSYSSGGEDGPSSRHSRSKVTEAAAGISDIAYDLHNQGHLCYLSTSSIPAILWATFGHLTDISSARDGVHFSSIGRFYQCLQALEELRAMYASADHAVWFLEAVIKRNDIRIPGLSIGRGANSASRNSESGSRSTKSMASLQRSGSSTTNGDRSHPDLITNGISSPFSLCNALMPTSNTTRSDYQPSEEQIHASSQPLDVSNIDMGEYWQQSLMDFDNNLSSYVVPTPGKSYGGQRLMDMGDTIIVNPHWT